MATRYGHEYGKELVEKHGWKWDEFVEEESYGDRRVIDPETGKRMNPHEGREIQAARDKAAST